MNEYFAEAYLDDYQLIHLSFSKKICQGISDRFYLVLAEQIMPLTIEAQTEQEEKVDYTLSFDFDLKIGEPYEVMMANSYCCPLTYRYIVKTERFNQEFYYDGDDLGANATSSMTSFKVWAPTASEIILCIGEQYFKMHKKEKGIHTLNFKNDLTGCEYHYLVSVNGQTYKTTDPYGKAATGNSKRSVVTGLSGNGVSMLPFVHNPVIYELSIRDSSENGTFNELAEDIDYLKNLGITHVQIMPINDFGSVNEYHKELYYNWGYDPVHYQSLEGSYSSDVTKPLQVIDDFKKLVNLFHKEEIGVIVDVVFNHHYYALRSNFNRLVPYYYYRYDENNQLCEGTGCGSECDSAMLMHRKFIVDTLKYYVNEFDVDGFRFDLMNFIDVETMRLLTKELKAIKKDIMLYGEGWDMQAGCPGELLASYKQAEKLSPIGFFNDNFRDIMRGNGFEVEKQGYISGNGISSDEALDIMRGLRFNWNKRQSINYVECHDDLTAYDKLKKCCPLDNKQQLVDKCKLLISTVLLSQGISFLHAGQEFCLSKNGVKDTYNKPDSLNKLNKKLREEKKDLVQYTKELIALKKKEYIGNNDEVYFENRDGVIISYLYSITIIINPKETDFEFSFDGKYKKVFDYNGAADEDVTSSIKVRGVSACILERE